MSLTSTLSDSIAELRSGAYMLLEQFKLLSVSGVDAATFLHSMLTRDIQTMPVDEARLAGLCSVKGRLLASLLAWRSDSADETVIQLMTSADVLISLQKRLSLFVLRAKVKLDDVSDATRLIGVTGINAAKALAPLFDALPDRPYAVIHNRTSGNDACVIRLPDADGVTRYVLAVPAQQWAVQEPVLAASLPHHSAATWDWLSIRAGEPRITAATQEKFVPQMINFELLGGVDFKKGCYPGQEVVARSQYLGKVKRRMVLAHLTIPSDAPETAHIVAGADVFSRTDPTQPCGMIVNAAAAPSSQGAAARIDCLVEIQLEALPQEAAEIAPRSTNGIHAYTPDGPELTVDKLLYAGSEQDVEDKRS